MSDCNVSDEQLYSRYIQGDNTALDELLIRHKDGLIYFIFGIVKNMDDAEDLMMDTFALLITKRLSFRHNSTFKTWLYGIGRNLARTHLRKKSRFAKEQMQSILPSDYKDWIEKNDMLRQVIQTEDSGALYQSLSVLNEEYANVLYLQYIEGLTTEQTAKVMKKTVKQIYNLTARAKDRLRQELEQ